MSGAGKELRAVFRLPFAEQIAFFRDKLALPSERWDDIWKSAHDRAFIVAGATQADLLADLKAAVDRAISEGTGLEAFRKDFEAIVARRGWTGWTGEGSVAGRDWRTRVIYQTNLATSYAAGRWAQLIDPGLLEIRPYWRYRHADGVLHPRPLHLAWNGLVLRHDHPFWRTHFPPNGWGCHCTVEAASARDYEAARAAGKAEPPPGWDVRAEKTGEPIGIDRGWGYAPGANARTPLAALIERKLIDLDAPIGAAMWEALGPRLLAERAEAFSAWVDDVLTAGAARGRLTVVGALRTEEIAYLAQIGNPAGGAEIVISDGLLAGPKAIRHERAGDALSTEEWKALPALLDGARRVFFDRDNGNLLYLLPLDGDVRQAKLAVAINVLSGRPKTAVNSARAVFKINPQALADRRRYVEIGGE